MDGPSCLSPLEVPHVWQGLSCKTLLMHQQRRRRCQRWPAGRIHCLRCLVRSRPQFPCALPVWETNTSHSTSFFPELVALFSQVTCKSLFFMLVKSHSTAKTWLWTPVGGCISSSGIYSLPMLPKKGFPPLFISKHMPVTKRSAFFHCERLSC